MTDRISEPHTESGGDWAKDLAHERLVELTLTHLRSAEQAAEAAETARNLARGHDGETGKRSG